LNDNATSTSLAVTRELSTATRRRGSRRILSGFSAREATHGRYTPPGQSSAPNGVKPVRVDPRHLRGFWKCLEHFWVWPRWAPSTLTKRKRYLDKVLRYNLPPFIFSLCMRLTNSCWELFTKNLRDFLASSPPRISRRSKNSPSRKWRNRLRRQAKFIELERGERIPWWSLAEHRITQENLRLKEIISEDSWIRPIRLKHVAKHVWDTNPEESGIAGYHKRACWGCGKVCATHGNLCEVYTGEMSVDPRVIYPLHNCSNCGVPISEMDKVSIPVELRSKPKPPSFKEWRDLGKPEGKYGAWLRTLGIDPDNV